MCKFKIFTPVPKLYEFGCPASSSLKECANALKCTFLVTMKKVLTRDREECFLLNMMKYTYHGQNRAAKHSYLSAW